MKTMPTKRKKNFDLYYQILEYFTDPVITISKSEKLITYLNYEAEFFFQKSRKKIFNTKLDFFFKKDSLIFDFIDKSLKKVGSFTFSDVELNFSYKKFILDLDIVNAETLDVLIIVLKKNDYLKVLQKSNHRDLVFFDNTLSMISHEVKNPLSSIKIAAQILKKKNQDKELTSIIIKECDRVNDLINSFQLNFIENEYTHKKINIHEVLRYVTKKVEIKNLKNINIIEHFDPSLPLLKINKNTLIMIFDNLIENAIQAIGSNDGYIRITTSFLNKGHEIIQNLKNSKLKNFIKVSIEDNGSGIQKNDLDNIFFPFFTTKKKGKGLGLFLVQKLIFHFNGDIYATSDRNNTKFEVNLPI